MQTILTFQPTKKRTSIQGVLVWHWNFSNGAGKSTTISILTSITDGTSGDAFVNGYDVKKDADKVRRAIGVTFQEMIIDEEFTGYQVSDYHGRLYGMGEPH